MTAPGPNQRGERTEPATRTYDAARRAARLTLVILVAVVVIVALIGLL